MCQKDSLPRIHWPAARSLSAFQNNTKLKSPHNLFIFIFNSSPIFHIDRRYWCSRWIEKWNYMVHIWNLDGWKMNLNVRIGQMKIKLFYHAKESGWETTEGIIFWYCFQPQGWEGVGKEKGGEKYWLLNLI